MSRIAGYKETLYIILYSLLGQAASALLILTSRAPPEVEFTPVESVGLSAAYTLGTFLVTLLILYLLRKRLHTILMIMFMTSVSVSTISALLLVADQHSLNPAYALAAGLILTFLVLKQSPLTPISQSIIAGIISYVIVQLTGTTFPTTLIILLSLYDVYTVYKGPLQRIIAETRSQETSVESTMTPLMVKTGGISVGMGDILAYTMAAAISYQSLKPPLATLNIIAIYAGISITVSLVRRKGYVPGLPVPVGLWLISYMVLSNL